MIKLPTDFVYENYGVTARFVTEKDAEFIVRLRSDDKLGRFIHASDGSVEQQIEWTREYKKREAAGLDYYFVFSKDGDDFGLSGERNGAGYLCIGTLCGLNNLLCCCIYKIVVITLKSDSDFFFYCHFYSSIKIHTAGRFLFQYLKNLRKRSYPGWQNGILFRPV